MHKFHCFKDNMTTLPPKMNWDKREEYDGNRDKNDKTTIRTKGKTIKFNRNDIATIAS